MNQEIEIKHLEASDLPKESNDTVGNRTRDLPACSEVPQPIAPPRDPSTDGRITSNRTSAK